MNEQEFLKKIRHYHFLSQWFPKEFKDEMHKLSTKAMEAVIEELEYRQKYDKLSLYFPYGHPETLRIPNWSGKPWQVDFHNDGIDNKERMLICANGVGKSISGAYETALHMTGIYPDWWEGWRFKKAPKFWIGSITNQVQKVYIQGLLLGEDFQQNYGTGFIPKELLVGKPSTRQCGMSGVADTFKVKHISGEVAFGQFLTYEQGWRKWQAAAPDGVWLDEEPDENVSDQKDIFPEAQTRLVRTSGILYVTYTPLLGQTHLTEHFLNPKSSGISATTATWDDAPHLKQEDKQRLIDTYPAHQVEARTQGLPMLGEGKEFLTPEGDIKVEPFDIPSYFARIKGIDFGVDHPSAVVDIAWDRDKDIIYITRVWRKKGAKPETFADAINNNTPWVPVSWPHDGSNREKSGKKIKDNYKNYGIKFLSISARYDNDTGGSQPVEPIVMEFDSRCRNGELKVFSDCRDFFEEYRNYHRKDGKLTKTRDDILKACFYAIMMKRYAKTRSSRQIKVNMPQAVRV